MHRSARVKKASGNNAIHSPQICIICWRELMDKEDTVLMVLAREPVTVTPLDRVGTVFFAKKKYVQD